MRDPAFDLLDGQRWAELEDFYVLRPDRWLERREVDAAGARSAVIAARKLDIVKMKRKDLNATTEEAAFRIIAGTARSMGIEITA